MALLRSSELRPWLLQRYGSASALAAALGVSRQTAHNLLSGRTTPNAGNCERLGLIPAFLVEEKEGRKEMTSLDDFLMQRDQIRQSENMLSDEQLKAVLVGPRGAAMIKDLLRATRAAAARVGAVDGVRFQWDDGRSGGSLSPLLKLDPVGAQWKPVMSAPVGGSLRGYRVVFGWVTPQSGRGKKDLPDRIWNLTLCWNGRLLAWNVNRDVIVGASSMEMADQIVKRLIEYRDEYQRAN